MNETLQRLKEHEKLVNKLLSYLETIAPNGRDYERENGFSIAREAWEDICNSVEKLRPPLMDNASYKKEYKCGIK